MSNLRPTLPVTATRDGGIIQANAQAHLPFADGDSYVVVSLPVPNSKAKSKIVRGYTQLDQALAFLCKGCPAVTYADKAMIAWYGAQGGGYYPAYMLTVVATPTLPTLSY